MEERDEEKERIFGVLGERQVGVVEKWAKDIKTRKANGKQEEKVIGSLDPEDKVYNGRKENKYYYKHECCKFNLILFKNY